MILPEAFLSEYSSPFPNPPAEPWNVVNYVYRDGVLLARFVPQLPFNNRFYIVDHQGTPRQTLDNNRSQLSQSAYYPIGEEATTAPVADTMRYRGMQRDFCCGSNSSAVDYTVSGHQTPIFGRRRALKLSGGNPASPQSWNGFSIELQRGPLNSGPRPCAQALTIQPSQSVDWRCGRTEKMRLLRTQQSAPRPRARLHRRRRLYLRTAGLLPATV